MQIHGIRPHTRKKNHLLHTTVKALYFPFLFLRRHIVTHVGALCNLNVNSKGLKEVINCDSSFFILESTVQAAHLGSCWY